MKTAKSLALSRTSWLSVLMFDAAYPPPVVGGKEKQAHLLAKALKAQGVKVKALSYSHGGNTSGAHEGVFVQRVSPGVLSLFSLLLLLVRSRSQFLFLHIHTPSRIGRIVALIGWLLRYQVVFKFPNENLLDGLSVVDRLLWGILLRTASLLVVLEEDTKIKLEHYGVAQKKLFHVANGVEIGEARREACTNTPVKLLFVGRLVPQKACDQLIQACGLLAHRGIEFTLTVVGDGPLRGDLQSLAQDLALEEKVDFEGYQADTLPYLGQADILVLPSQREGMSNVLLEAISVGLPIVATDVGSARKQVGPFGEQFLCKRADPEGLANCILKLATNPELRIEYGVYLHKRGQEMFSIEAVAEQYLEQYRKLI